MTKISSFEDRLKDIVRGFFRSKLGIRPLGIEVLQQEDRITIRIRGFLTPAEAVIVGRQKDRQLLTTYYERIVENLYPLLRVVIQDTCKRPLVERRTVIDLSRDECIYLLTLGEQPSQSHF